MKVGSLHGEMSKLTRANVLNDFRKGRLRALVVSDVVARGLDVSGCDAVFNSELPSSASHYAHRAGRTGRMDAPGVVVSIVTGSEAFVIDKLSKRLGVEIQEAHVVGGKLEIGPAPPSLRYDDQDEIEIKASGVKQGADLDPLASTLVEKPVVKEKERSGARAVRRKEERDKGGDDGATRDKDEDEVNEVGEEEALDVKGIESRVRQARALSNGRVPAQSNNPKIGSVVKKDLGRELEELRGEKQERKTARYRSRQQGASPDP